MNARESERKDVREFTNKQTSRLILSINNHLRSQPFIG